MIRVEQVITGHTADKGVVLALDVFDGVHLGHQKLLHELKKQADQLGAAGAVIILNQSQAYLTSLTEKVELLRAQGIDTIAFINYDRELADYDYRRFITLLQEYFKIKRLLISDDFTLENKYTPGYPALMGPDVGCKVISVPPLIVDGKTVSSKAVHDFLANGDMKQVSRFTGRYFRLCGHVISGHHMARRLGFPTANLEIEPDQVMPPYGTYATFAHLEGVTYRSMTAFGIRPHFANREHTIEVHILDFNRVIYNSELKVDFVERLREGIRFGWIGELSENLGEDVKRSREVLSSISSQAISL